MWPSLLLINTKSHSSTVNETGCILRANAYDQTVELHQKYSIGWVIWELMILTAWYGLSPVANLLESRPTTSNVIQLSYEVRALSLTGESASSHQILAEFMEHSMTALLQVGDGGETRPETCVYA